MLHIYLTRHGQDKDNAEGILNGRRNQPLTNLGVSQAKELAHKIKETGLIFDRIYTSPLKRTSTTAQIIADTLSLPVPAKLPLLIERDFGIMSGQQTTDIEKLCSPKIIKTDTVTYFLSPPKAEKFPVLYKRAIRLIRFIQARHNDGNVLLVTHGDFGKMIYAAYYRLKWRRVLKQFHFGNSELLLLSPASTPQQAQVFQTKQYNL